MDYFPRDQLHASLSVADVHLITMRAEMTGVVVPGKLYGAMASGAFLAHHEKDHCCALWAAMINDLLEGPTRAIPAPLGLGLGLGRKPGASASK